MLDRLRCIQLDPLDVLGTNADLVAMARVDGVARGDVWRHLFPRYAFEHFAKERCILPARAFPYYRRHGHEAQTPWWQHGERARRVPAELVRAVLEEIRERGPLSARELTDRGAVEPLDWSGWMGTSKATSMALEILWTVCDLVVTGRTESGAKIYDLPERAFGDVEPPREEFPRWALRERVLAAGLLTRAGGSMWSMLGGIRTSGLVDEMVEQGELVDVIIEGSPRRYLASPSFLATKRVRYDDRVRILGPLDPLLWDRNLVRHVFDFEYVWEVYKPAHLRKWGWYVCPLLHRDTLIGRIDARVEGNTLIVKKLWLEGDGQHDDKRDAILAALERHAELCGAKRVRMPRTRS
ncbi:MAG: winged helix DNA-binding domain-containing protein [Acidobacteriota bacterium]|nr:winged helix DNA-binding domain-containing protein [Acidobacteriota bacterium]